MPRQSNLKLFSPLSELKKEPTVHGSGLKQVFRKSIEMTSDLTQVAFGTFYRGEVCEEHIHPTMIEYFFFIQGTGIYMINGKDYKLESNTFLEIPAGLPHSLKATSNIPLKFIYWGVAID